MTDVISTLNFQNIAIKTPDSRTCLTGFQCGTPEIDKWVKAKAWKHHSQNRVRMFCSHLNGNDHAIGFYCLSFSAERPTKLDNSYKDIYKHSGVPLIYIQYIAVTQSMQSNRIGTFLLMDALRRSHIIGSNIAVYGVALRSLNERTTKLYSKFGFSPADEDGSSLMIVPIWTIFDLFDK